MATPEITMISATPSPFARMNRIALIEKGIPFTLQSEIPWHKDTKTPQYNPLEKLPILLFSDGRPPVYDSSHIQEYIVQKYRSHPPALITGDLDLDLEATQIQVLSQGVLDAFVLAFWELNRPEDKRSQEWLDRQNRKVDGGFKAFDKIVREKKGEYLLGNEMTIADIALTCAVAQVEFGKMREGWGETYPELRKFWEKMEAKESFKQTTPVMFDIKPETVV